jgi:ribokinase
MGRTAVAVVGSVNLDLVVRTARRPEPGETVMGDSYGEYPGGKGGNQAVAAAAVAPTALVAARGADPAGEVVEAALRRAGVDAALLTADRPTGRAVIQVTPDGENSIVVLAGANAALTADFVEAALGARRPAVVLTQLETPAEVTVACCRWAAANGARFLLNASPVAPLPDRVLAAADPLVVNAGEARGLAGPAAAGRSEAEVAGVLAGRCRSVVVTCGARGAVVAAGGRTERVAATPATAVRDTTGAGDAFAGTLAAHLARGAALLDAAHAAGRAAAQVIQASRGQR